MNHFKASTNDTALIFAAKEGNVPLIKELLAKGANPLAVNRYGNTALIMAAQGSNAEVVALLLEHGSDVNAANEIGNTALLYAAYSGHEKVAKILIQHGANVGICNRYGSTPLIYAAYNGHLPIFLIEEAQADIDKTDLDGRTALMWAIIRGHANVEAYLLEKGADATILDNLGNSAENWSHIMHRG